MRFLLNAARRSVVGKSTLRTNKMANKSVAKPASTKSPYAEDVTKSWGQQCSPSCGCVLRFEARVDHSQRIIDCNYVAKSVVATIDQENGGKLRPLYTTRMNRPMLQECKCQSVHALANSVTSYVLNKRWSHIQGMNDFELTRSSVAFRHAVLAENNLPRKDTHCFDVVEEAFTGMINGKVPSKRRIDAPFKKILAAECLQSPSVVHYCQTKKDYVEEKRQLNPLQLHRRRMQGKADARLGVDKNRIFMSTSKTMSTLGMFDINSENWLDEDEYDRGEHTMNGNTSGHFDWVSYVDDLQLVNDSA
mmetsp:Transcript_2417/g.5250  ORF Transcript_2417/g.5250 Transcript_2417/m.5250 type:complete len:305 (+) Transcript_2417:159-1073(+)